MQNKQITLLRATTIAFLFVAVLFFLMWVLEQNNPNPDMIVIDETGVFRG